jgi:hypothetical protein
MDKDFLQHIVGFCFFMNHSIDGGPQSFAMPAI